MNSTVSGILSGLTDLRDYANRSLAGIDAGGMFKMRVTAFMKRFIDNCRKSEKQKGPLTTKEFEAAEKFWITQVKTSQPLKSDVGLKQDEGGIFRYAGRVQHYNPVFLPRNGKLAALIVRHVHEQTLHGGVSTTLCRVREKFWIPKLRSLTECYS